jgi:DNA mismatch endonuclease (patch repair protein)
LDSISSEKRSWNMSRIKSKDTKIEVLVRKYLFAKGYRFRKNDKRYPGKPDVVLPKYKTVIFVNGCFWHMHPGCKYGRLPKSNTDYWKPKLEKNVENDKQHRKELQEMGWQVIVLWECELKKDFEETMEQTVKSIENQVKK